MKSREKVIIFKKILYGACMIQDIQYVITAINSIMQLEILDIDGIIDDHG